MIDFPHRIEFNVAYANFKIKCKVFIEGKVYVLFLKPLDCFNLQWDVDLLFNKLINWLKLSLSRFWDFTEKERLLQHEEYLA